MESMLQCLISCLCEMEQIEHLVIATVKESILEHPKIEKIWQYESGLYPIMGGIYTSTTGKDHAHANLLAKRLRQGNIDFVHLHPGVVAISILKELTYLQNCPPILQTLHGDMELYPEFYESLKETGNGKLFFNTVSEALLPRARELIGKAQVLTAIENGMDFGNFHYPPPKKDGPFITLTQKSPDKGQDIAASVCHKLGVPLLLAGPLQSSQRSWYEAKVMPYVDGRHIKDLGSVTQEKYEMLARAPAYLAPVRVDEPGGISAQEALASGTPVIAMRRGNYSRMVQPGINGMLADTWEEFKEHVKLVATGELTFDPAACRASVEHLSSQAMADSYLNLYEQIIGLCKF